MPRARASAETLSSFNTLSRRAGLKRFTMPANGLAPLSVAHCRPPAAALVVVVVEPVFPVLPVVPLLPEVPLFPEFFEQKYVFLPVLMTLLPSEAVKFDFPDCWEMVTLLPSDETYVAEYVNFFPWLSLFSSCWICELLSPLAVAGRAGSTTTATAATVAKVATVRARVRISER
jgi:hypothetical protein